MSTLPKRWTLPLVIIAIAATGFGVGLASISSAHAEPGFRHASRGFGPHHMFRMLHRLDVSREQRTAIGEIMDQHRPIMREFMFDMMDGKEALQAILTSENYDPKQIETLAAKQAENAQKMFLATAKSFADISAILTAEQRKELAEMMEDRGRHWGDRHRGHGDHEPPEPM